MGAFCKKLLVYTRIRLTQTIEASTVPSYVPITPRAGPGWHLGEAKACIYWEYHLVPHGLLNLHRHFWEAVRKN